MGEVVTKDLQDGVGEEGDIVDDAGDKHAVGRGRAREPEKAEETEEEREETEDTSEVDKALSSSSKIALALGRVMCRSTL